jgi:hypothetical protein
MMVEQSSENLKIWLANEKTNPAHTKPVNQRGGFTAIDAYQQIKNATEYFGPVGKGWGWTVDNSQVCEGVFIVQLHFWYRTNDEDKPICGFNVFGAASIAGKRVDDDAPKKAMTDAITKGLSYLGFNSDVFLGLFDDSKYVAERVKEEAAVSNPLEDKDRDLLDTFYVDLKAAQTADQVTTVRETYRDPIKVIVAKHQDIGVEVMAKVKEAIARTDDPLK